MSQGLTTITTLGLLREIPRWCSMPGADLAAGLFQSRVCMPYTADELRTAQLADLQHVCRNAADPQACVGEAIARSDRDVAAAEASAEAHMPGDTCEYQAALDYPTLSSVIGPSTVCKFQSGVLTPWIIGGVAAVVVVVIATRRN